MQRHTIRRLLFFAAISLSVAAALVATQREANAQSSDARRVIVRDVKSWAVQYRRIDALEVAASPFDLVVIDYRPDVLFGTEFPFSREDVRRMQRKPDGSRRLVVAYLSVGEAEDYRGYWSRDWTIAPASRPAWIGKENVRWLGNFPVRFWNSEWQSILFGSPSSYLDRIVAAGFNGVYLDRVDVYQEFTTENAKADEGKVSLLTRLADHAHRLNPRFLVVLQNAEELTVRDVVRKSIDAFTKEDLFYGIEHDGRRNSAKAIAVAAKPIRELKRSGTKILLLEYPRDATAAAPIRLRAKAEGFTLLLADRELAALAPVIAKPSNSRGN